MLTQRFNKQRQAASVVKTALISVGINGRSVCVQSDSWLGDYGRREEYAVFVTAPNGANIEPYYETGSSIVEAVRKMIDSIKGKANSTKNDDQSDLAPF